MRKLTKEIINNYCYEYINEELIEDKLNDKNILSEAIIIYYGTK